MLVNDGISDERQGAVAGAGGEDVVVAAAAARGGPAGTFHRGDHVFFVLVDEVAVLRV